MGSASAMTSYSKRYLEAQKHDDLHNLIKELINENTQLKKDNLFYRNIEIQLLHEDNQSYKLIYQRDESPMAFDDYKIKHNLLYFMTITYDPERFDNLIFTSEEQQKEYILYSLYKFRNQINFIYGCFEKQTNGIIHAHLLINYIDHIYFINDYLPKLKSQFTKRFLRKNHKQSIDNEPVKDLDKVLNYIDGKEKEKYGFFLFYNSTNFL